MRLAILAAGLCVIGLGLGAAPGTAAAGGGATKSYWQERYRALHQEQRDLGKELDEARATYSRGRRDKRLRGDGKVELVEKIERLEARLESVEGDLASFEEDARRAGALPGWFRDLEPAAPQNGS